MAIDLKSLNQNQLTDLVRRAELRLKELEVEKKVRLREKMTALAKAEGLSLDEVIGKAGARKTRGKVKPKYRNPADKSQTWSGRGKRPRWFNAALTAGKKESDMLIR